MHYSWLRYLVILLITLQSVMAVADTHSTDQVEGTNSDLGYQINLLGVSSAKNTADQSPDSIGVDCCLDCGDCNCCAFFTFSTVNLNTSFNGAEQLIVDYLLSIVKSPFFPFLHPPKS